MPHTNIMPEERLPSFSLSETQLPEVASWEVGEKYFLVVEVEQTGKRNRQFMMDRSKDVHGEFQVVNVKAMKDKDSKDERDKSWEKEVSEKLSGGY